MPSSQVKMAIAKVLKDEGYVAEFHVSRSRKASPSSRSS